MVFTEHCGRNIAPHCREKVDYHRQSDECPSHDAKPANNGSDESPALFDLIRHGMFVFILCIQFVVGASIFRRDGKQPLSLNSRVKFPENCSPDFGPSSFRLAAASVEGAFALQE